MPYMDVFVMPVLTARESDYLESARLAAQVWRDHGALSYVEGRAENVPEGKVTSFPMAVKLQPTEVLYLGYATYRDRAHRDEVNAKVMEDPRLQDMMKDSPANMQRMIWGGFATVIMEP
jgi:uncharacterized protein YbaA (DUF1428 family)